jgi:nitroreductase
MSLRQDRRGFLGRAAATGAGLALGGALTRRAVASPADESPVTDVFTVIHHRRSVRRFTSAPVPDEDLHRILDAARMAPTSGNQQPWKFLVVRERERLDRLAADCVAHGLERYRETMNPTEEQLAARREEVTAYFAALLAAPVLVVILTDRLSRYASYNQHDGPLAAGTLMLAARALGYGTLYATDSLADTVCRKSLGIPKRYVRVCASPLGVPAEWPETPEKKELESLIVWDSFS